MSSPPKSPYRIAFFITELDPGGAERCLVELATRINLDWFSPTVISLLAPKPGKPSLEPALHRAGIDVHCLGVRGWWGIPLAVLRLIALLYKLRPHLVQTFLFHANLLGRIAAWRARVPRVVSGIRVAERRGKWRLKLDCWTEKLVDRHVCVSQSVADFSRNIGKLTNEKLVVIPNGVDVSRFDAAGSADLTQLGVPRGKQAICFIGRLDSQKGLESFLEQAPNWLSQVPDFDLLLIGEGALRGSLESLCQKLGITDRVHFTGFRIDIPEILHACRLLVLPSCWEGMPNVVLEAMAASRPVLATDVEGVAELLGAEGAGQIVPVNNPQAMTAALVAMLQYPESLYQWGEMNRRRVEREFSLSIMVGRYEELYRKLLT